MDLPHIGAVGQVFYIPNGNCAFIALVTTKDAQQIDFSLLSGTVRYETVIIRRKRRGAWGIAALTWVEHGKERISFYARLARQTLRSHGLAVSVALRNRFAGPLYFLRFLHPIFQPGR